VSASSQNQVFNALLFLYRHVIKREFGEIKDIPGPNANLTFPRFYPGKRLTQLSQGLDIRTIQELLGHSNVRTTMIYTHTIKSQTIKEAKSPLDFSNYSNP